MCSVTMPHYDTYDPTNDVKSCVAKIDNAKRLKVQGVKRPPEYGHRPLNVLCDRSFFPHHLSSAVKSLPTGKRERTALKQTSTRAKRRMVQNDAVEQSIAIARAAYVFMVTAMS